MVFCFAIPCGLLSCPRVFSYRCGKFWLAIGRHVALITVVGQPLAVASIAHLYPHVFVNILVMIPTMMWSMYLLYRGIPIVLKTSPENGILMASSLLAWLLVAAVSLLGLSMMLWTVGMGPLLGV